MQKLRAKLTPSPHADNTAVHLNVGGRNFETVAATLTKKDGSPVLADLWKTAQSDHSPSIFIDRDGTWFRLILASIRGQPIVLPQKPRFLKEVLNEAEFFKLPKLVERIQEQLAISLGKPIPVLATPRILPCAPAPLESAKKEKMPLPRKESKEVKNSKDIEDLPMNTPRSKVLALQRENAQAVTPPPEQKQAAAAAPASASSSSTSSSAAAAPAEKKNGGRGAAISVFEMFTIGLGPSSSHTIGPMRACLQYTKSLQKHNLVDTTEAVELHLYGSLALTGEGHMTTEACLLGLSGQTPRDVPVDQVPEIIKNIFESKKLHLGGWKFINFEREKHIHIHKDIFLPYHPNGMELKSFDKEGKEIWQKRYYSIGGGFFVKEKGLLKDNALHAKDEPNRPPSCYSSMQEVQDICKAKKWRFDEMIMQNELFWHKQEEVEAYLLDVWRVMREAIEHGLAKTGELHGGLHVIRRANGMMRKLKQLKNAVSYDFAAAWAMAVQEENSESGRVVTAPTLGSCGIVPAVLMYYLTFLRQEPAWGPEPLPATEKDAIVRYLMVASLIGALFKMGASISGAEVGCQGEVGVACAMAAAGLTSLMGGSNTLVEAAAETGMEHNLGLTCDPVRGLVQIPCIERNAVAAVKAITACRIVMSVEQHLVSLDEVINTMRETGRDMSMKYKETALGGLAVNVTAC